MSSEWPLIPIGEVAQLFDGPHATPKKTDSGPVFLGISSLKRGQLDLSSTEHLSEDDFKKWTKRVVPQAEDIVFSYETRIGEVAAIPEGLKCCLGRRMALLRPDKSRLLATYLLYYFLSDEFQALLKARTIHGSTVDRIPLTEFPSYLVRIPPLDVQSSISSTLQALDDRITLLRETNATLEAIAQALFKSWFVDFDPVRAKMEGRTPEGMDEATAALFPDGFETSELGEVPKGWRVSRLADVTERITKGTTPTTLKRAFVPSGINFVKAESMTGDGGFIAEKFAFIDSETHALLARSQLQDGDVLISIAGTIGRLAVMTEDFLPANTNQAVALIRPNPDLLPSGLIYRLLRRNESQQKLAEKVVQAVQANLSLGTLSDLKLVVPPPSVVGRIFGAGLEQIDLIRVANDQRIRTLSTLRDTLLPRLISGQLRLPEAQAATEAALGGAL